MLDFVGLKDVLDYVGRFQNILLVADRFNQILAHELYEALSCELLCEYDWCEDVLDFV